VLNKNNTMGPFFFGLVLPLSGTAETHRPQGVTIVGIYMSSNIYYLSLLYLSKKSVMQMYILADV